MNDPRSADTLRYKGEFISTHVNAPGVGESAYKAQPRLYSTATVYVRVVASLSSPLLWLRRRCRGGRYFISRRHRTRFDATVSGPTSPTPGSSPLSDEVSSSPAVTNFPGEVFERYRIRLCAQVSGVLLEERAGTTRGVTFVPPAGSDLSSAQIEMRQALATL